MNISSSMIRVSGRNIKDLQRSRIPNEFSDPLLTLDFVHSILLTFVIFGNVGSNS